MTREEALEFLTRLARGMAEMLGPCCETLVHDMAESGHPILAIYNGGVSGRNVGCTLDVYGIDSGDTNVSYLDYDYVNHQVTTMKGRYLKSSTFQLHGEGYHLALGVNLDFTAMRDATTLMESMMSAAQDLHCAIDQTAEAQLDRIFESCVATLGMPVEEMTKRDRLQVITLLKSKNAFSFQKSVSFVSQKLGVSRYTIYKYLNEVK